MKVTARTSSFAFKNQNLDAKEIGERLQVKTLLDGSIWIVGKKIRIRATLIDTDTGFNLWSETFDRFFEAVFALQDEICLLITDKLREFVGHLDVSDHLVVHPGVDMETYQKYLRAKFYLYKFNKVDVQRGLKMLDNLTKSAPQFAQPYLSINYAYTYLAALGLFPAQEAFGRAKIYLDRAIEIDKELPECHLRRAGVSFWQEWDIPQTFAHLNNTLKKQPGNAEAHLWMGVCFCLQHKFEAAHHYLDKALAFDPFSPLFLDFKGAAHYFQGNYPDAIQSFQRSLSFDPNFLMSHVNMAAAELISGDLNKGLIRFQNLPPSGESDLSKLGGTTLAYAMLGEVERARAGIEKLRTALQGEVQGRALFFLILIHIQLKEYTEALDWLELGIRNKLSILITIHIEPFFHPLKPYQRFQDLVQEVLPPLDTEQTILLKKTDRNFDLERAKQDFAKLDGYIKTEYLYLDAKLNLRNLANKMDWHPNYLSRIINACAEKNFSEYINSYRLENFKNRLKDPKNRHLTILALAYESGFNSKTAFNTFFKKTTGLTPKKYWQQYMQELEP